MADTKNAAAPREHDAMNNPIVQATFDARGLASLTLLLSAAVIQVQDDNFALGLNGTVLSSASLPNPTKTALGFRYTAGEHGLSIDVAYSLGASDSFVTKSLTVASSNSTCKHHALPGPGPAPGPGPGPAPAPVLVPVPRARAPCPVPRARARARAAAPACRAPGLCLFASDPRPPPAADNITNVTLFHATLLTLGGAPFASSTVASSHFGMKDYALFARWPTASSAGGVGAMLTARNPFLSALAAAGRASLSYAPMARLRSGGSYATDPAHLGLHALTNRTLLPPAPALDEAEHAAMVAYVHPHPNPNPGPNPHPNPDLNLNPNPNPNPDPNPNPNPNPNQVPIDNSFPRYLAALVDQGIVPESRIDE